MIYICNKELNREIIIINITEKSVVKYLCMRNEKSNTIDQNNLFKKNVKVDAQTY